MKKRKLLSVLLTLVLVLGLLPTAVLAAGSGDGVPINETNFPDANFRQYVSEHCDSNKDGTLSAAEIAQVEEFKIPGTWDNAIADLKGIEYFTSLTSLECPNNQLTSLDVSKNTSLTFLNCSDNQLTSLDVTSNTSLTCLDCSINPVTTLDLSKNTALTSLDCRYTQMTTLDLSRNTALSSLDCSHSSDLTALDLSNNTSLISLYCRYTQMTALDLSKNTALIYLNCSDNQLTALDVSNNPALSTLCCSDNQLTTLDLSGNTSLIELYCSGNQLNTLDASRNVALTNLDCSSNQLNALDVSKNTALANLDCSDNQLTALDVSNATLCKLNCTYNQLTSLDVSKNVALTNLDCSTNHLNVLDVSKNTALTNLDCSANQLNALDVHSNTSLSSLDCHYNQLGTLDISKNVTLTNLDCSFNRLNTLDIGKNTALTNLNCSSNQLTALDVSNNTRLVNFACSGNHLTALDLSHNKELFYPYFNGNKRVVAADLPIADLPGFDIGKVSNVQGGSFDNGVVHFNDGSTKITYTYDTGYTDSAQFTLVMQHEHVYSDKWTCINGESHAHRCIFDGCDAMIDRAPCIFGDRIIEEATCTKQGSMYVMCPICGHKEYVRWFPATGHTMTHYPAKAATVSADGNMEYWACASCGKLFSDADGNTEVTAADVMIPRLPAPVTPNKPAVDVKSGTAAMVRPALPETATEAQQEAAQQAYEAVAAPGAVQETGLASAVTVAAKENGDVTVNTGKEQLLFTKETLESTAAKYHLTAPEVVAKPYLQVQVKDAEVTDGNITALTYDVSPFVTVIMTEGGTSVLLGNGPVLVKDQTVTITLTLPENFVVPEGHKIQVLHTKDDGTEYTYDATLDGNKVTFENPNGFSTFTVKSAPVASTTAPQTGDSTNVSLYLGLMVMAVLGMGIVFPVRRAHSKHKA